jgi:hypothetical protein
MRLGGREDVDVKYHAMEFWFCDRRQHHEDDGDEKYILWYVCMFLPSPKARERGYVQEYIRTRYHKYARVGTYHIQTHAQEPTLLI